MRGASALETLLEKHTDRSLRVLVVWEPVLFSDIAPPTTRTLSRLSDSRVEQYWDKHLLLSKEVIRSAREDAAHALHEEYSEPDSIVWDFVALYPPGARWESSFPSPIFHAGPVVRVMDQLERHVQE